MARWSESELGVWFDDLDPYGVLHNMRYLALVERALWGLWEDAGLGPFSDPPHLVRANHIAYHRPVRGPCRVRVRVWFRAIGRTSMTYGFQILSEDGDRLCADGERTVVCIDPETERPTPWPASFRDTVQQRLHSLEPS